MKLEKVGDNEHRMTDGPRMRIDSPWVTATGWQEIRVWSITCVKIEWIKAGRFDDRKIWAVHIYTGFGQAWLETGTYEAAVRERDAVVDKINAILDLYQKAAMETGE